MPAVICCRYDGLKMFKQSRNASKKESQPRQGEGGERREQDRQPGGVRGGLASTQTISPDVLVSAARIGGRDALAVVLRNVHHRLPEAPPPPDKPPPPEKPPVGRAATD
jgi:hypothetical protein